MAHSAPTPLLLLDTPLGTALSQPLHDQIVVTAATGEHYLIDVLEAQPLGLIVEGYIHSLEHLLDNLPHNSGMLYVGPKLPHTMLTPSERRVLRMLVSNMTNAQIARRSSRSVSTINTQVSAILEKMGVHSRQEAVNMYWGIHSLPSHLDNERLLLPNLADVL